MKWETEGKHGKRLLPPFLIDQRQPSINQDLFTGIDQDVILKKHISNLLYKTIYFEKKVLEILSYTKSYQTFFKINKIFFGF